MKELRKKRLQELIASRFNGSQSELTKAMGWSSGRASQLLDAEMPFGEDAAKKIVEKLGLDQDYFSRQENIQMINVVTEQAYVPTGEASRLAMLFDMIPENDLIRRSQAYSAASTAIVAVIEGHKAQATAQPVTGQKTQLV